MEENIWGLGVAEIFIIVAWVRQFLFGTGPLE
jgi:hypothetical protein